jgi:site-specific DNA-methyltransferase (adenine-specific)
MITVSTFPEDEGIDLVAGDCLEQIPLLPDGTVQAVITSPPYAMKRKQQYGGISEKDYPAWMVSVFNAIKPKLTEDGSIFVNIRSHVEDGTVSDYVLETRLALRKAGFFEKEELIWYKPESAALGSILRPRRTWEHILWFATCKDPYVNLRAAGKISRDVGNESTKKAQGFPDLYHGAKKRKLGIARVEDLIKVPISANSKNVKHTAMFPPALVEHLILTHSREDDVILDPFAGSGTTLFVARFLKRYPIGIERKHEYVRLIRDRERNIDWRNVPPDPNLGSLLQFVKEADEKAKSLGLRGIALDFVNGTLLEKNRWKVLDGIKRP